jgi:dUTPase
MELTFVKFFPVKSPIGLLQNEKQKDKIFGSVGVDYYMPLPTKEFFEAVAKSNPDSKFVESENYRSITHYGKNKLLYDKTENKYYIFGEITIPTGIGLLIPEGYFVDNRPKSSSFNLNYSVVLGTIDEDYTYSTGAQITLFNETPYINIEPNQKFMQFVLIKGEKISKMNEVTTEEWDKMIEIQSRRGTRQGGFGHTGKF